MVEARAEGCEERIGAADQHLTGDLAAGDDVVVESGRDAESRELGFDEVGPAGGVGQQDDPLAGLAECGEAIDGAGQGVDAVVDHTPKIDDEAVEVARGVAQAMEMFHCVGLSGVRSSSSRSRRRSRTGPS